MVVLPRKHHWMHNLVMLTAGWVADIFISISVDTRHFTWSSYLITSCVLVLYYSEKIYMYISTFCMILYYPISLKPLTKILISFVWQSNLLTNLRNKSSILDNKWWSSWSWWVHFSTRYLALLKTTSSITQLRNEQSVETTSWSSCDDKLWSAAQIWPQGAEIESIV